MAHKQTQTEWEEEMSKKILTFVRHELYLDLRFMEPALSAFAYRRADGLLTLASNGVCLFFSEEPTLRIFEKNSRFLNRVYLHSALHCLFRHLWQTGGRNLSLFYLACDIAVEFTIDSLEKESVKRALSWLRLDVYSSFRRHCIPFSSNLQPRKNRSVKKGILYGRSQVLAKRKRNADAMCDRSKEKLG